ncbi:hypothetical protein DBB_8300 [Desulfoluna spongiiphila]|nr:hypothetical protein DBB_8300 [Desulfoluna spongiiphila]
MDEAILNLLSRYPTLPPEAFPMRFARKTYTSATTPT